MREISRKIAFIVCPVRYNKRPDRVYKVKSMPQKNTRQLDVADEHESRINWYTPRLIIVPVNGSTEGVGTQTPEPGSSRDFS
jgi:hypothetical protein